MKLINEESEGMLENKAYRWYEMEYNEKEKNVRISSLYSREYLRLLY